MKKKLTALFCAIFLLLSMVLLFASCGGSSNTLSGKTKIDSKEVMTVTLTDKAIYKDTKGDFYYINVDSASYLHSICNLHSFTKTPPTEIKGFSVVISSDSPAQQALLRDELQDPFVHKTENTGTAFPNGTGKVLRIYDKLTLWNNLSSSANLSNFLATTTSDTSYNNYTFVNVDWAACQQSFEENNEITLQYTYRGQAKYMTIKVETFTYCGMTTYSYTFAKEYSMVKTPYYDAKTGELTAYHTTIVPADGTSSLSFFEYQ